MSYSFGMFFKQLNSKEEALDFMTNTAKTLYENGVQYIKDNKYFIPSIDSNKEMREADRFWLYSLFSIKFVWWEDEKLLGMSGYDYPFDTDALFDCHIVFQNSSDQNYPYEEWSDNVIAFKEEKENTLALTSEEVLKINNIDEKDFEPERLAEETEYWRRSTMYGRTFERLDLGRYIDGKESETFSRIYICALDTIEKHTNMHAILRRERGDFAK